MSKFLTLGMENTSVWIISFKSNNVNDIPQFVEMLSFW